jgi:hypothetical protein
MFGFVFSCYHRWTSLTGALKFDAPIGYPSITANYTPEWKQWWFNPKNVNLYQFMGKDNVYFHTVYWPSVQIGDGRDWTKLHHLSTTGKFPVRFDAVTNDADCRIPEL